MMFGKLGGEHAEFRCRPYQNCLSDIAVTHSPRYLIDMELQDNDTPTIFELINSDYNDFRILPENEKITILKNYYKTQTQHTGKIQMPWWMGNNTPSKPALSLFSDMSINEKNDVISRLFILFPEEVLNGDYKRAALWMCSRYSVINPNMRDYFSAGGKVETLDDIILPKRMPQVLKRLYYLKENIISHLTNPSSELIEDIIYCWDNYPKIDKLVDQWGKKVNKAFSLHDDMKELNIKMILS